MMLDPSSTIAVVGASLAGLRAAETLRAEGHTGTIVLIGAEPHLPYDRPPLSKQFLAGTWGLDRVVLRPAEKIASLGLDLRLGHMAGALDVEAHTLELDDGDVVPFDGLVLATGAQPRRLPGAAPLAGVHTLRTLEDSMAIGRLARVEGARVVVVGAGFIGSEVAATCRGLGAHVTVIEALAQPLVRVLGAEMGAVCGALHVDHDVKLLTGVGVSGLRQAVGADRAHGDVSGAPVDGVELDDGSVLDADVVVIGIGVVPTTQWLEGSGLLVSDGVVAEATLHAGDDVVVAGDVARWLDQGLGVHVRIEHWTNAAEQGVAAARNLLAGRAHARPYVPVPYFWSDQYDVKIQMIGHPGPDDDVVVVDGTVDERRAGVQPPPPAHGLPPPARGGRELRRRAGASPRLSAPAATSTPGRGGPLRRARIEARSCRSSPGVG
jgi:3-phenylpropionate/trans-cinnamate dioxygenase ferredoxin reductase component